MTTILMCSPLFYDVFYEINPWMSKRRQPDKTLAKKQWQALYDTIVALSAHVVLMPPVEGLPDMVFTANAGLPYQKEVMIAAFHAKERQGESAYFKKWFEAQGYRIANDAQITDVTFEGAGDALFLGQTLIAAYGFRSSKAAYAQAFFQQFDLKLVELVDPYFYHLDTCFCPLNEKEALWYPGAFSKQSQHVLSQIANLIEVNEAEAKRFACNAVVIDQNIILPTECETITHQLQNQNWTTFNCDMSEYIKAGGACKCLTLKV